VLPSERRTVSHKETPVASFPPGNLTSAFISPENLITEARRFRGLPPISPGVLEAYSREDTASIEEIARWLKSEVPPMQGIQWVREKCRPRSPNAIPFKNLGKNLIFSRLLVSDWIRNTPRLKHSPHRRRTKAQMEKEKV
jgi:hypothetical protein